MSNAQKLPPTLAANPRLDRWVTINADGTVTVRTGKVEIGQGIVSAMAQVAAEELDVEIWPTCIVVPKGYRVALTIRGRDYEWEGEATTLSNMKNPMRGCGPFVHDDETDRPPAVFGGKVTLHMGPKRPAHVLLPVIPAKR